MIRIFSFHCFRLGLMKTLTSFVFVRFAHWSGMRNIRYRKDHLRWSCSLFWQTYPYSRTRISNTSKETLLGHNCLEQPHSLLMRIGTASRSPFTFRLTSGALGSKAAYTREVGRPQYWDALVGSDSDTESELHCHLLRLLLQSSDRPASYCCRPQLDGIISQNRLS